LRTHNFSDDFTQRRKEETQVLINYLKPADKSAEILECGDSSPLFVRGRTARWLPAAVAG
jgi:hypothetical protein